MRGFLRLCIVFIAIVLSFLTYAISGESFVFWEKQEYQDRVFAACEEPSALGAKKKLSNQATIYWEDTKGTAWNFVVQDLGGNIPTGNNFQTTTNKTNIVTTTQNGNALVPNSLYEFYVQSDCGSAKSKWVGPFAFQTACTALVTFPFLESFDSSSKTKECWRIIDNNKDGKTSNSGLVTNMWSITNKNAYKGNGNALFNAESSTHDDLLVSPPLNLNGGLYEVIYYYQNDYSGETEYELLLSDTTSDVADFTYNLVKRKIVKEDKYTKVSTYITGYTGAVYLGWRVIGKGTKRFYIDEVSVTPVSCYAPEDEMFVSDLKKDGATIEWVDSRNTQWEYYVGTQGAGMPTVAGVPVSTNKATVNVLTNGGSLLPDTTYDFYVRSSCGKGQGKWVGPVSFKTLCSEFAIPFEESFDIASTTKACWTIVDSKTNKGPSVSYGEWRRVVTSKKGTGSIYYKSYQLNNDWLISPSLVLDVKKLYKVKYYYKTDNNDFSNFEVSLSNTGVDFKNFTHKIVERKQVNVKGWTEEQFIISNIGGIANIGFYMKGDKVNSLYIDEFSIEEVTCGDPFFLGVKEEKKDAVTIFWTDDVNTSWEYVMQLPNQGKPVGAGVATTKNQVMVNQLINGGKLVSNTAYEYYVRSKCSDGSFGEWQGPFGVRTTCDIAALPFTEGFNSDSSTIFCWQILDGNDDGYGKSGIWHASNTYRYEGTTAMRYEDNGTANLKGANDWLISPSFDFKKGKVYRLSYMYSTDQENVLQVYASNKGNAIKDFTHVVTKDHQLTKGIWRKNKEFVSKIDGEVRLAWGVFGEVKKAVGVDQVIVEEVKTCPEPLNLDVSSIQSDRATLQWTDAFGAKQWEYVVQVKGGGIPTIAGVKTTSKSVVVTSDKTGKPIQSNTSYEYYVRTDCGDGTYSEWSEPFEFKSLCGIYKAPFVEGFNTDSTSFDCWKMVNNKGGKSEWKLSKQRPYEGDRVAYISFYDRGVTADDWLISPPLDLENGQYILKYFYKTSGYTNNVFAVKLSDTDTQINSFKQVVVPKQIYKNVDYVEEVVVFNATQGINYIGWQMNGVDETYVYLDKVSLKKVENCVEPYKVVATSTTNSLAINWTQIGTVQSWEVKLVDYTGDENSPALVTRVVTGNPNTVINGLPAAKGYKVYVRAMCTNSTYSDWSTGTLIGTKVTNDTCNTATTIPVNADKECVQVLEVSMYGSTDSTIVSPDCFYELYKDVWFEFTAISNKHILSVLDFQSKDRSIVLDNMGFALYEQNCNGITSTAKQCREFSQEEPFILLDDLVIGQKYLIRIGMTEEEDVSDLLFKLCLTTRHYIHVDETKYTFEQLVKNVLVESTCDLISNVKGTTGTDFGEANGIGYFEKGKSNFAFDKGIVLATTKAKYSEGPGLSKGEWDSDVWLGDKDLQDMLEEKGDYEQNYNASVLEFDFVPVANDMSFDFIFASNEYGPAFQCGYSDLFAFILTDLTTNEKKNIAVVPNTNIPISVTTIHDAKYQGDKQDCGDANKEYFDKYYGKLGLPILENAIYYGGRTIPMKAKAKVVPGRKYHIKLAIADYSDPRENSAVFLEAGSFKIGEVDLGTDLLVETGNALCGGTTKIIDSQLDESNPELIIKWTKDGKPYPLGDNKAKIEVSEAGIYEIEVNFKQIDCPAKGKVKVEFYPPLELVLNKPTDIAVCRFSNQTQLIDLTLATQNMPKQGGMEEYEWLFFEKEGQQQKIDNPEKFEYKTIGKEQIIYLEVISKQTKCTWQQTFKLVPTEGVVPVKPENVIACNSYTLPGLAANQDYYSEAGGKGKHYKAGDKLGPGNYDMYVYQDNGKGCYEEVSFKIAITEGINVGEYEDITMECSYYTIPKTQRKEIKFYKIVNGKPLLLEAGTVINESGTKLMVVAETEDKVCREEVYFSVYYNDCPIPKGFSPNGDGINDSFDLSLHGVSSLKVFNRQGKEVYSFVGNYKDQWTGKSTNGKELPSGTYYYVVQSFDKARTGWVQINR
ncbi:MAG: choice-of-anchor J domain-containing protein [Flavobacteriaceae bacterium]|jgi:gliding motility-associated-like protein|nr:choice-of-anchor J domain-containing protein [Flavobacteriaceae bacterium]